MGLDMWFLKMKDDKKWDLGTSCWSWDKFNRSPKEGNVIIYVLINVVGGMILKRI